MNFFGNHKNLEEIMRTLTYLFLTQLKNRILSLRKKPALLITYSIVLIFIIAMIVMSMFSNDEFLQVRSADERIMFLIIGGLGFLFLYIFTNSGLSTGSTLFSMSDVGLLFAAPISSKKILMYGLIQTLGKALFAAIFIFYQVVNLKTNFGYGLKEILSLFIIYALIVLICQLASIGIYIFSTGKPVRKNLVKLILYLLLGVILLAVVLVQKTQQVNLLEAALRVFDSTWFSFVPVAGWSVMFFSGIIQGSIAQIIISLLLFLGVGIAIISLLTVGTADYYEDVLLSTETTFLTLKAAKEGGKAPRRTNSKIKVRDKVLGISRGRGAMTLAYKHILELNRKSRFVFIDSYTMFMAVAVGIAGYNLKGTQAVHELSYVILAVAIYFQFFLSIMGKLKEELLKPYIFMIPAKSIVKVFAASVTSLLKPCIDGVIIFGVFTAMSGVNPFAGIFFALSYAASGTVFVGITILFQRVLGGQPSKIIQSLLVILILVVVMSPAVIASIVTAYFLPPAVQFLCLLPYIFVCLLFAGILFLTCGNLIDKSEFTGKL